MAKKKGKTAVLDDEEQQEQEGSKKEEKKLSRKEILDKIMAKQNADAGSIVVGWAGDIANPIVFMPSASEEFNQVTGGGFPRRRITEVFGSQSSGKTSLVLESVGEWMEEDPEFIFLWGETEEPLDLAYAEKVHGIDPKRFLLLEQTEQGGEKLIDLMESYIRSGAIDGFCVNSVAGLAPKKELESDMDKDLVAVQARFMSRLMRKWTAPINKKNLIAIFINQIRVDVGKMFGDPTTTPGGKALSFYASLRVGLNRLQLGDDDPIKTDVGMKTGMRIAKNRCVYDNPYKKGEYYVIYGVGIDKITPIINNAPDADIIRKSGSWYYYEKEDGELIIAPEAIVKGKKKQNVELRFNGRKELYRFMNENKWFMKELQIKLREAAKAGKVSLAQDQTEDELKEIARLEKLQAQVDKEEEAAAARAAAKRAAKKAEKSNGKDKLKEDSIVDKAEKSDKKKKDKPQKEASSK